MFFNHLLTNVTDARAEKKRVRIEEGTLSSGKCPFRERERERTRAFY